MISTDRRILEENSEARQRMVEYGNLAEELHIIVFSKQKFEIRNSKSETKIKILNSDVFLYPTNSRNKLFYICDGIKIGKKILREQKTVGKECLITAQDAFETGFVGWRLAKRYGAHLQLQVHTDFLSSYFGAESVLNKVRVLIGKFLIKRADSIRVVSGRIKSSILKIGVPDKKIFVLPIFVDTRKIKDAPVKTDLHKKYSQFDFIILMASRFSKEKNIELAISAFKEILPKFPKTGLIIVGSGSEKQNYLLLIADCGLQNNVIMENWTDDIASYYKTVDLFLLTSNYEGYGRTLIEAAAAERKIISTDVGVAPEILEKENIFEVGSENDLVKKLIAAIGGEVRLTKSIMEKTKEEYLVDYKKYWETFL